MRPAILRDCFRPGATRSDCHGATEGSMSATYERLLVPVNGSAGDQRALALVADLVHQHPASITLIYVVGVQQAMPLDAELPAELDRGEVVLDRAEHFARNHVAHKL